MLTATNPTGETIEFEEVEHTFRLRESDKMLSGVTSFLKPFFNEFDSDYWSKRKAKERGVEQCIVLDEWAAKAKRGRDEGHNVHSYAEHIIKKEFLLEESVKPEPLSSRCEKLFVSVEDAIEWLTQTYTPIGIESIVFSKKLGIAGIIDALVQNDERVCIVDWKQNKAIKSFNPYQNGKGPIAHLEDHDFNKYSLQLNSYRRILIEEGYYPDVPPENITMMLVHLTPDSFYPMRVKAMDSEITAMLSQKNGLFPGHMN